MMKLPSPSKKSNPNKLRHLGLVVVIMAVRLAKLIPNMSALGSYGFFGKNPILFGLSIVVFDLLSGGFYKGYLFTYLGFAMYATLGKIAGQSLKKQAILLPLASFCFFLCSNFGVWLFWYPHTLVGLIECYVLAIPFYKLTLLGDLLFGYGYLAWINRSLFTAFLRKSHLAITQSA